MPVDRLIPEFLQREDGSESDDAVLHECRHCGSKFEEAIDQCPVCGATEIATYEFATDEGSSEDAGANSNERSDSGDDE
ncbi:hypothetical protein EA462_11145 [Natrarchaeobius halalkaliphilus]|uniref:Uncharacterized protein n=1 Tax=Natrarchaeobius halalkaliphilus TaxID=1679091 RepID=A0A3N6M025_9EURY|nr:hypothetical protein [Natrarchaeobius halalkaliphilus]RQG88940.1 hypothetical protein EA462_11145 [Natrarchaeobius halalkaliphilus]